LVNGAAILNAPTLQLHCGSHSCGGVRTFVSRMRRYQLGEGRQDIYLKYQCRNCGESEKVYSLALSVAKSFHQAGVAYKYGEHPLFGPPTSRRLLTLLAEEKETFLKGRRVELEGLGIGAFAYYRRVVENQKGALLDEIIKVAHKANARAEVIATLQAAKNETQFKKAVAMVSDAIPESLRVNGHNPLTLLHSALSEGLHNDSDEKCLELATAIRVVMQDLADRVGSALKDRAELDAAVNRLTNRGSEQ
jgi:hypothetical protein